MPASCWNYWVFEDDWIEIRVDPTVELFCTIHRLARTGQDATNELLGYIREIEDHFGAFRNHRAVELAGHLWETHQINIMDSLMPRIAAFFEEYSKSLSEGG